MLEMHVTKEGDRMLIAQMTDEHLVNFINLVLKQAKVAQGAKTDELTDYHRILYNLPVVDERSIAEVTREALQKLYPYLAEAYLRGIDTPRELLQEVMGRDKAVPNFRGLAQLPSVIDEDDELPF
jgi:hypothetical protein